MSALATSALFACASTRDPLTDVDARVAPPIDSGIDGARPIDGSVPAIDGALPIDSSVPIDGTVVVGPCPGTVSALISEVNPNLASGRDMVELRVTAPGTLMGLKLVNGNGGNTLVNLPAICAATGDIVVLHLSPATANGNSGASETTAKNQFPQATNGANYDGAWDVNQDVTATGIAFTDSVLILRRADSTPVDTAIFSNMDGTSSATYISAVGSAQAASQWLPATCGGAQCQDVAADFSTVGDLVTSPTIQRLAAGTDSNTKSDFSVRAETFGRAN